MTFLLLVYYHTSLIKTTDSKHVGFGEKMGKKRLVLPSSLLFYLTKNKTYVDFSGESRRIRDGSVLSSQALKYAKGDTWRW